MNTKSTDFPKKVRKKQVKNIANISYTSYSSVERALKNIDWEITDSEVDNNLFWCDSNVGIEFCLSLKPWQFVNHFPGTSCISRKIDLSKNYMKMKKYFPKLYNFHPKSFCLPAERTLLQKYMEKRDNNFMPFIVKPDLGSQGKGIFFAQYPSDLDNYSELAIAQEYISPFLIDGLKFDLRIYALVTSINPLRVYIYKDGLARFCTEKYETPDSKNVQEMYRHLTNYSVNKKNEKFEQNHNGGGHKQPISRVMDILERMGYNVVELKKKIDEIVLLTVLIGMPHMSHSYQSCIKALDKKSRCFEILGFDILIDSDFKPWILEVNHSPSLACDSQFDADIKEKLIEEAIEIMNIDPMFRKKITELDRERTLQRINGDYVFSYPDLSNPILETITSIRTGWKQLYPVLHDKDTNDIYTDIINRLQILEVNIEENSAFRKRRDASKNVLMKIEKRENAIKREPKPFITSFAPVNQATIRRGFPTRSSILLAETNRIRIKKEEEKSKEGTLSVRKNKVEETKFLPVFLSKRPAWR